MQWYPLDKTRCAASLGRIVDSARAIDPYLIWAEASQFKGFDWGELRRDNGGPMVLAKATSPEALRSLITERHYAIPAAYQGGPRRPRVSFFTAHVAADELAAFIEDKRVEAVELAIPVLPRAVLAPSGPAAARKGRDTTAAAGKEDWPGNQRVIGIIDYGCPFLHKQFRRLGQPLTRILRLWDQGPVPKAPWQAVAGFRYGRELRYTQVNAALADLRPGPGLVTRDELEIYREHDYLFRDEVRSNSPYFSIHGGHVLDVAAGLVDPLTGVSGDTAGKASIIFVQLPLLTAMDSSGGSLQAHVLDALHYIITRAADAADLVVNLSFGTQAGPHDGSSLIERAIDELIDACRGRLKVVLPAGNSRLQRAHVESELRARQNKVMCWRVPAEDTSDSFLEIWYPKAADGVEVRFTSPLGQRSEWVGRGASAFLSAGEGSDEAAAGIIHRRDVANGGQSMILLALAPTQMPENVSRSLVAEGVWTVELRLAGEGKGAVKVDAWIERDEPGRGGAKTIACFEAARNAEAPTVRQTLGSYATGHRTLIVGACRQSDGLPERYSSEGTADGRGGPHLLAAASENEALQGIRSAAVRSEDTERMSGTSMAAPAAARRLFNLIDPGSTKSPPWRGLADPADMAAALLASQIGPQVLRAMATRATDDIEP